MKDTKYDFGGWATRNDIRCSDGRTIKQNAFKHCDGRKVPLIYMHSHDNLENVVGYAVLENRPDGVYAYGALNHTDMGETARELIKHGDIDKLSIYANHLEQTPKKEVLHGDIKEVSLVLSGANPGAVIDQILIHGDGDFDDNGLAFVGDDADFELDVVRHEDSDSNNNEEVNVETTDEIEHADNVEKEMADTSNAKGGKTVKEVFDAMSEEQKTAVYALVAQAVAEAADGAFNDEDEEDNAVKTVKHSVFDTQNEEVMGNDFLSHDDMKKIFSDAKNSSSLKDTILAHADEYGIDDIDILFPDARTITESPDFIRREDAWVAKVMNGVKHVPFTRLKSIDADLREDAARAKGYIKGNLKKDEVFSLLKRTTEPTTIYKKQRLDRNDILDINSFNVVAWLKSEMRIMMDEEIARAILVGDGRLASDDDHIDETKIRPIAKDTASNGKAFYSVPKTLGKASDDATAIAAIIDDEVVLAMEEYKGSGTPTMFIRRDIYTRLKLRKDAQGYRLYKSDSEIANATMVSELVPVPTEIMGDTYAIVVDLKDYSVGTDKGGELGFFDDFDIDYNQQKYLMETRCSGSLMKPYSALVFNKATGAGTSAAKP